MSNEPRTIRLDPADNVSVALDALAVGDKEHSAGVAAVSSIPAGHKMAVESIAKGDAVRKFNQIIGFASNVITPGQHVHTQNCVFEPFERDYQFGVDAKNTDYVATDQQATFQGFCRANGRIGTRNYIGILSSVNCSATVIKQMADRLNYSGVLDQYPNIDGVVAFAHGSGCGMDMNGEGFGNLQRVMHGFAGHPNFAAVVMVGLGCEVFQISMFKETFGLEEGKNFVTLVMQEMGGSRKTIEEGVRRIEAVTGAGARAYFAETEKALSEAAKELRSQPADVPARVKSLLEERRKLERELADARKKLAMGGGGQAANDSGAAVEEINGVKFSGRVLDGVPAKELKGLVDDIKKQIGSGVVAVVSNTDGKASLVVGVTDDLTGKLDAVALVRAGSEAVGGKGGGGRPDMAQAGGPDGTKADEALAAIKAAVQ